MRKTQLSLKIQGVYKKKTSYNCLHTESSNRVVLTCINEVNATQSSMVRLGKKQYLRIVQYKHKR